MKTFIKKIMSLFSKKKFNKKYSNNLKLNWQERGFPDLMKPENFFLGGDGLTEQTPVFLNCRTTSFAQGLMEIFISKKHGVVDIEWSMGLSITLSSDKTKCGKINAVTVDVEDSTYTYYFDLSRPYAANIAVFEMLNKK